VIFLLVLCLPLTTVFSATAFKPKEIDFIIWLERPEKQVVVDEIILKLESLGITVNAIYMNYDDWTANGNTDDYDLRYGPESWTWDIDNIFQLAWLLSMINPHMLRHTDKKLNAFVDKLVAMSAEATDNPDVVTEDFIEEMIDTFQKAEKRLWVKKYILPFAQWVGIDPWGIGLDFIYTEVLTLNCFEGNVFSNINLRKRLFHRIDRSVFLDYHATYNPYEYYTVYHLFQMSIYHDTNLPNH